MGIKLNPNNPWAWVNRGAAYQGLHQHDKALDDFSEAIKLGPKEAYVWVTRGAAYQGLHQHDKAIADFSKAVEADPKNPALLNRLAWLLATCPDRKFLDARQAVALAKKAVELAPAEGNFWNTLGVAQYRARSWNEAVAALEKSTKLHKGSNSFDWFFLAMAHWQLGEKEKARDWYDKAAQWMDKNQPNNEELGRFRAEAAELLGRKEEKN
jgi:tetratricopeptide (TPR) repeat protein